MHNVRVFVHHNWSFETSHDAGAHRRKTVQMCPVQLASAQSSYLKTHMRIYMMKRPFKCNQCEKTYKSKGDLTRHARTHQTSDKINVILDFELNENL